LKPITGIKWPFTLHLGKVALSRDENHIKESVSQIIGIGRMEYLMRPTLGCSLVERVFDPVNVQALVEGDIKEALERWEPRVKFIRVRGEMKDVPLGKVRMVIEFIIKGRNEIIRLSQYVRS